MTTPHGSFITIAGRRLEIQRIAPTARRSRPPQVIVLLHEGIGSVSAWRDFPAALAHATGCEVVVYSRYGYGQSDVLDGPRAPDFMHREALETLPQLIRQCELDRPVLFGHSDGASIALIYAGAAAARPNSCLPEIAGVVVEAPHVFVENEAPDGARRAREAFDEGPFAQALARHHRDARKTFFGWHDIWTSAAFRDWNIEDSLAPIKVPVLAIQGEGDEYGTMAHLDSIARRVSGRCDLVKLADCGHAPHRDQAPIVLERVTEFVRSLDRSEA